MPRIRSRASRCAPGGGGTRQSGQASVELVALLPLLALITFALWQLALAGQAAWLAGAAARAAARAHAVGGDERSAARGVLPGWLERDVRVRAGDDGSVTLRIGVPSVVGGRLTTISSRARFEPQA